MYLQGKWYAYFAADDGDNIHHRLYVLENASTDPMQGEWTFKGQINDSTNKWAIDGDVEHVVAETINGNRANTSSDYKILVLTDTERRIRLDPQGYIFIGHRVQKFEFPDCAKSV